jgi:sporulation protein YlmC with PRC-barrel domain
MKRWLFALAVPALTLFVTANTFGQDKTTGTGNVVRPAGQIMGMDVRNTKNESLGHIQDIVINMRSGNIVYVAMARDQVLGFGGSLYAIAPEALKPSPNHEYVILDANNADFENVKGFDQNSWPNQPDRRWGKTSTTGAVERTVDKTVDNVTGKTENLARISAINGLYVYGRDDKSLGSVYDLAVNCGEHKVIYAAVQHGGTLGIGGKLIAVPWNALTMKTPALNPQRRAFYLDATQQEFDNAQGFNSDRWPAEANTAFKSSRRD